MVKKPCPSQSSKFTATWLSPRLQVSSKIVENSAHFERISQQKQRWRPPRGSLGHAYKKDDSSCQKTHYSGILQQTFSGSKTHESLATSNRSKYVKPSFTCTDIQDGNSRIYQEIDSKRGVDYLDRPHRRLFPCSNTSTISKISEISDQKRGFSVSSSSFWCRDSSPRVHSHCQRGQTHSSSQEPQNPSISGRLASSVTIKRSMSQRFGKVSSIGPRTRLAYQFSKIGIDTHAKTGFSGLSFRPSEGSSVPNPEETRSAKRSDCFHQKVVRLSMPQNRSRLRRQINRCNHILNRNKGCFYRDLVSENCGDSKRLWHALNRTLSRSNSTVLPSFDDEKSLANRFGSFFIDKIKKIRDTFKYTRSQVLHPDKEPPTFCSFQAVTETEVLNFIKESPSKTCSLDPCPTHIVKQCIDILLPSLTKLVNLSLKNGIFPNPFKQAIVTPLLKKSTLSKEDLKSYRPVSGLSFLSKLVERIVAAQIRSHMDSRDLGNTFQSAYKVGHSTETALLCIKNEIHLSLSKGMPTALVLLDLSAAFDTIDHDTLLSCLSSRFGFAGSALKWFRSYLQDRFQSVKIGSSLSNLFKLKFGVPQGSVLGPLLFSLYTTPLSQVIRKYTGVRYHFYADDTQLFIHLSPDDSLKSFDRLKSCLNDIQVWMSENKLKLNPDKTEFIVFGAKDRHKWLSDSLPVNILGNCLSPADVVRNLGVLFDAKFFSQKGWGAHLNEIVLSGLWSNKEAQLHINVLELKAVLLALKGFQEHLQGQTVLICSDNSTVVAYLNKEGGTHSIEMRALIWRILAFTNSRRIQIRARHVPGSLNVIADSLSRRDKVIQTEWSLHQQIFRGHGGRVVTLSPPTSGAGVRSRHGRKWESW